jgi:hypothetical protein
MFTKITKIRTVVTMLVAAFVFGLVATSAFALTAEEKGNNMAACRALGGSFVACCIGAGGTYTSFRYGQECRFVSDKSSTPVNVVRPPVGVVTTSSG